MKEKVLGKRQGDGMGDRLGWERQREKTARNREGRRKREKNEIKEGCKTN